MNDRTVTSCDDIGETVVRFSHASGMRIHLIPKDFAMTYAALGVCFGSFDRLPAGDPNAPLPGGTAHFLEHKMFDLPGGRDAIDLFSGMNANANAFTANEYTAYTLSCTSHFEDALSAMLHFVTTPHFTRRTVKKEFGIISQEIASYQDDPGTQLYLHMLQQLYPTHPIRWDILGTPKEIRKITPALLSSVWETYYQPAQMILCICGRYHEADVLKVLDSVLPSTSRGPFTRTLPVKDTSPVSPFDTFTMDVARPRFMLAFRDMQIATQEISDKRGYTLEMACSALFSRTGELYRLLYDEGFVGRDFQGSYEWSWGCAHLMISGESDHPLRAKDLISEYLSHLDVHMPSEADFLRVKNAVYADHIRVFDSAEDIALSDLEQTVFGGDFFTLHHLIRSITYSDFCQAIHSIFDITQSTFVLLKPEE